MEPARVTEGLSGLVFDNRFVRELPADPDTRNLPRQVLGASYSWVTPAIVVKPELVAYSRELGEELRLSVSACLSEKFARVFAGNRVLDGMETYACCYGGHQFGHWAGQLGDGRAINLGEVVGSSGARWTLQLKGAGPTPYSRSADGLAVLRSSIREFLCSEAMYRLGVPTTRALSLVVTGEDVERDMFYDGHPKAEPGAVVCRMAHSFVRFGSFEIHAARGENELLKTLADYTILSDFPHLGEPSKAVYVKWFTEVCRRTAEMIVHWNRVGFVHGVMNTDNMSILGQTIDYGPYGWLEDYDPDWTPNTTDAHGRRYRFGAQADVAHWNLAQLGRAILPLVGEVDPLQEGLRVYSETYDRGWSSMMASKLGLRKFKAEKDEALVKELFEILQVVETDMTIFFRRLAAIDLTTDETIAPVGVELGGPLGEAYYQPEQLTDEYEVRLASWLGNYRDRLLEDGVDQESRQRRMDAVNPKYVLRNYLAQLAIDKAEEGDYSLVNDLLDLLRCPYDEQPAKEEFAQKRPEWARNRPGCSMLSCSS